MSQSVNAEAVEVIFGEIKPESPFEVSEAPCKLPPA
jgi:hypothetical protein